MNRTLPTATLVVLSTCGMFAQSPAPLAFEVASIKTVTPSNDGRVMRQMGGDDGMIDFKNVTLRGLLMRAYRLKDYQVTAPDWASSDGFDIVAKFPAGATRAQVPEMLQTLLAERFQVTLHREKKDLPIYALVVAKGGPKLKPVEQAEGLRISTSPKGRQFKGSGMVTNFADSLGNMLDRPVVDMTELKGTYDLSLEFAPEDNGGGKGGNEVSVIVSSGPGGPPPGAGGGKGGGDARPRDGEIDTTGAPSLFTALQATMGLKLEARKAPVDILIIDRAEKPTAN